MLILEPEDVYLLMQSRTFIALAYKMFSWLVSKGSKHLIQSILINILQILQKE